MSSRGPMRRSSGYCPSRDAERPDACSPQPATSDFLTPLMSELDRDLASIAEARAPAPRGKQAWTELAEFSQEKIDGIVDAMAAAATPQAEPFARLAVEET